MARCRRKWLPYVGAVVLFAFVLVKLTENNTNNEGSSSHSVLPRDTQTGNENHQPLAQSFQHEGAVHEPLRHMDSVREEPLIFQIRNRNELRTVVITSSTTPTGCREAIAAAVGLHPSDVSLVDVDGTSVDIQFQHLRNGAIYRLGEIETAVQHRQETEATSHVPQLQRVLVAVFGTGRYRALAISALQSVQKYMGSDCSVTTVLLTDKPTDLPQDIIGVDTPYRGWPGTANFKFRDLMDRLKPFWDDHDYFYSMDADTVVAEEVLLMDISGDLVGASHPIFPRYAKGFCGTGYCDPAFERNPESAAYVPPNEACKIAPENVYAKWSYLNSAFWGGKVKFVLPALAAMDKAITTDVENKVKSKTSGLNREDERYVNWYFWTRRYDPAINLRILGHSYNYPGSVRKIMGDWLHNTSRPIIAQVERASGHLLVGEVEIESVGNRSQCLDPFLPKKGLSLYGCHHQGGSQGWYWTKTEKTMRSLNAKANDCMDAAGLKPGTAIELKPCDTDSLSQQWDYDESTFQFINIATKLCLDSSWYKSSRQKKAVGVKQCQDNWKFQQWRMKLHNGH